MSAYMKNLAAWQLCTLFVLFVILSVGILFGVAGARINTSASIPVGLYWTSNEPVKKGSLVMFCPPKARIFFTAEKRGYIDAGLCPSGYGSIMKEVFAVPGDHIAVTAEGVEINGKRLANSKPLHADPAGRLLPVLRVRKTLAPDEYLLLSTTNPLSFDGRYFGPIAAASITTTIRPVLTWN